MDKKYHLLYRITNEITLKEYIGVHSTNDLEDGYMGSGSLLKKDIKQFGASIFRREIIECFDSRSELLNAEKEIVNEHYLLNSNTYNLVFGGGGIKTIALKRKLFNKPIFSKQASDFEIKTSRFKKYDENYQYIFDLTNVKIERPRYILGAFSQKVMDFIINNVVDVEYDLSKLFNNQYTNSIAQKFVAKLLLYKGLSGNIFVDVFDWNGNFVKKHKLELE